jgi:putative transcriptional regulator
VSAPLAGQLLVATPRLGDASFRRTVVLVLNHDDDGALGVVLNRPSGLPVGDVLPGWARVVAAPTAVFGGGPVAEDSALAVGIALGDGPSGGFHRVWRDLGLVDLDRDPAALMADLVGLRIFSGYAGWSAGQLEDEVAEGSWYVVASAAADLLTPEPEDLWRRVLRRQPGELAYVSTFPDNPDHN